MFVPTGEGAKEEFARAHEMAHVKITPADPPEVLAAREGISPDALNIVEDLRVHTFMRTRKIARPEVATPDQRLEFITKHEKDSRKLAGMLVACAETSEHARFRDAIKSLLDQRAARNLLRMVDVVLDSFVYLQEEKTDDPLSCVAGFSQLTAPIARLFDAIFPPAGAGNDSGISAEDYLRRNPERISVPWGELKPIRTARMTLSKKTSGASRTWSDEGVIPAAPYRLLVDSRVFSRKRRVKGGTVLIDASGSMGFAPEDLAAVIQAAPGATIAAYAGKSSSDWGRLVIVAKAGRMATAEDIYNSLEDCSGNVVDGPALRWLAKQPEPRIWVSDGIVTGVCDRAAVNLLMEANAVIAEAGIERIEDWKDVVAAMR
jgi:hypothetical protein